MKLKLIFLLIIASISFGNVAISQDADKPTTIKSAKNNLAQKKRKQEKLKKKAKKQSQKNWLKLQTKDARKRIKKNARMNDRKRKGKKSRIY